MNLIDCHQYDQEQDQENASKLSKRCMACKYARVTNIPGIVGCVNMDGAKNAIGLNFIYDVHPAETNEKIGGLSEKFRAFHYRSIGNIVSMSDCCDGFEAFVFKRQAKDDVRRYANRTSRPSHLHRL
jgi:hypothetical protein